MTEPQSLTSNFRQRRHASLGFEVFKNAVRFDAARRLILPETRNLAAVRLCEKDEELA